MTLSLIFLGTFLKGILHNLELSWSLATSVRALRGFDTNPNETASRKVYTGPCWPLATTGACSRQSSRDQDVGWATQGRNTCVGRYRNALLKVNLLWIHGRTESDSWFSVTPWLCVESFAGQVEMWGCYSKVISRSVHSKCALSFWKHEITNICRAHSKI